MTPLEKSLIREIEATGPISIAAYMTACLLHPEHGYYMRNDPIGASGDFITAPEVSQMFGELIGITIAQCWLDQDAPDPFVLAELGPGRATLMQDLLRATRLVPGFHNAMRIALVETSPVLRVRQRKALAPIDCAFFDTVDDLPNGPLYLVANEFFDALPIQQFIANATGWQERVIGLDDGKLAFGLRHAAGLTDHAALPGEMRTISPSGQRIAEQIGDRLKQFSGAAVIIDYGDWDLRADTLQAVSNHEQVPPLTRPGEVDLTAHVDFKTLAQAADTHCQFTNQGQFLERLGITARAQQLARHAPGIEGEHRRLTHPSEMGALFKVLGLTAPGQPMLAGFE